MDYRTYLDFVIAMENPKEPQSVQYVFRVMDIDHKGYLDAFTLHYFYKVHDTQNIGDTKVYCSNPGYVLILLCYTKHNTRISTK